MKRYDASIKWITLHDNAVIGNGPFYLNSYNPAGGVITIKAFRDPSYPFPQGYWASFESPKLASIQSINSPSFVTLGQPVAIKMSVEVGMTPSNNADVNYFISNKNDKVILQGTAEVSKPIGTYVIPLQGNQTSIFSAGPNTFKIFTNSKQAFKPDIYTGTIIGIPKSSSKSVADLR
jgi:peptide/nickel transport system substrate-binding protein